ncbi:hypothetical protein LOY42_20110 [Pseudomonas sp. B21-023]|uniref:hypothetical protein n=1 Tax=unclassified Pseudomonas TaxID=196821 RepID=UPI001119D5CA|nr:MULTISPECIES: hypothetical protein [unclassified Pseudomonas]UVL18190.1 hypothetical protein LOY44_19660 [Pseudomonas sp. B21-044]UVM15554.1 hypothetical protein LOY42_20110 [Pseudomonas sp. B21-023]
MTLDPVRLGTPPSGTDGDDARTAFTRINANFAELDNTGFTGHFPATREVSDCNHASGPGWWSALGGTAANLPPGITYPCIYTAVSASGFVTQLAIEAVSGKSATRAYNVNNAQWTAWVVHANAANLGTAAAASLTASALDATPGRVLKVGDHGIGADALSVADLNALVGKGGVYRFNNDAINRPPGITYGAVLHLGRAGASEAIQVAYSVTGYEAAVRYLVGGVWRVWVNSTPAWLGQTWQNMTGARAAGVAYTNDTGRPIQVSALFGPANAANVTAVLTINGLGLYGQYAGGAGVYVNTATAVVPPGASYSVSAANGAANLVHFFELR